jgi:hypothetical protein
MIRGAVFKNREKVQIMEVIIASGIVAASLKTLICAQMGRKLIETGADLTKRDEVDMILSAAGFALHAIPMIRDGAVDAARRILAKEAK